MTVIISHENILFIVLMRDFLFSIFLTRKFLDMVPTCKAVSKDVYCAFVVLADAFAEFVFLEQKV